MGDLAEVALGLQRPMVAPVPGVSSAGGATQGASGVRVVGAGPQLGDDVKSLLRDLVMCGIGIGGLGSAVLGDTALAPGSSSATCLGVSGLYLPDSLGFPPSPINWRRVGDKAEFACTWVVTMERLLHKTLILVDQNILHLIQVSLKKRG
jgi:hypothetical protein